jgi:hypothetical protein
LLKEITVRDDRVQGVAHLMRNCRIDDLLERFLSFDLLVKDTKCHIFEVNNGCVFAFVLDFFFDDTEQAHCVFIVFVLSDLDKRALFFIIERKPIFLALGH